MQTIIKRLTLIVLFLISISTIAFPQSKVLAEGEELTYIVYYGFIKLGEVKMKVTGKKTENEMIVYSSKSTMKSYSGIPFVSLNSIFESDMVFDGKEVFSNRFKAIEYKEESTVITEYKFNYDSNFVHVYKNNGGKVERDERIGFNDNIKFQDGLSLFYNARLNSFSSENFLVPVFINETETSVNYFFASKADEISISLFDDDVNSVRCDGTANFTGVFGLTGEFAGWFSYDEFRIPLKSQLNVIIGNVTLELDSYKRIGWKQN